MAATCQRRAGEEIGYPLQYSWASLVAQLVKNPPAMRETWVRSLGWEGPLEKGKTTLSGILAWRMPWSVIVHGVTKSRTRLSDFDFVKGGQQGTRGAGRPQPLAPPQPAQPGKESGQLPGVSVAVGCGQGCKSALWAYRLG